MNRKPAYSRSVTEQEWAWTFLGLALLFGSFVRILPGLLTGFPINDGGMFAVMMRDLRENNFLLPAFTTYNLSEIPYAYPPLGFYIGAFVESLGVFGLDALIYLPMAFTVVTIPSFYLLAHELTGSRPHAALAAVFFALAPGNYIWLLMGGGLTRALGMALMTLSFAFVHRALREMNWRTTFLAGLFCALTVLSHPQSALLTFTGCAVFWFFGGRSRIGTILAFVIAMVALLLSSPWWGSVAANHGFGVFLSAGQSGDLGASLSTLLGNLFSRQTILPFSTVFWLLGLGWAVFARRFDLLVWGFLPYLVDQRSAPIATSLLYPILAAYGFLDVLPALINLVRSRKWNVIPEASLFNTHALAMGMLGIAFYLFIECVFHAQIIRTVSLTPNAIEAMVWARENTPAESSFLILTGREDVMTDPVQEWFPALAERHSETTLQGLEWTLKDEFVNRWAQLGNLQSCRDADCIRARVREMDLEFTHLLVDASKLSPGMFLSEGYEILFDNGRYVVLK
ncbi:MAG: hypothetical protein HND47_09985 [Chloroflexi bacterium]|nr:hypothetical protein [Chloroflexota bacterium]